MSQWISAAAAAEYYETSLDAIVERMIAGEWPMMIEHGCAMVDIDRREPDAELLPEEREMLLGIRPASSLPRAADGRIDADALADGITLDYHAARAATARRRRPPVH